MAGKSPDRSNIHAPNAKPSNGREGSGNLFRRFAHATSTAVGSPWAFLLAVVIVIVWGVTGPIFKFSNTWQLVINTGTTIVTFLMVFLIQNTQNRDARAMHLKLDELIRSVHGARNHLVDLEDLDDEELDRLQKEFQRLRQRAPQKTRKALGAAKERLEAEAQRREAAGDDAEDRSGSESPGTEERPSQHENSLPA